MALDTFAQTGFASRLNRRGFLAAGIGGAALLWTPEAPAIVASPTPSPSSACILSGEQTEGPYYVDRKLLRRDITEGRNGVPLTLRVTVLDAARCSPVQNAAVDLWHCDASGIYSGYTANHPAGPPPGFGVGGRPPGPPPPGGPGPMLPDRGAPMSPPGFDRDQAGFGPPPHRGPSDNKTFFRGVQITNANGVAEFATIYPGWYFGRCTHIHLKVWTGGSPSDSSYVGGHACHTGQLFFPEDITAAVARLAPYKDHRVTRILMKDDDVYTSQAGPDCIVTLAQKSRRSMPDGFIATAAVAVNPAGSGHALSPA